MNDFQSSLPVLVGVAVAVTSVVSVFWLLHAYSVSACRKELQAYKEHVVALSDKVDALKERHKLLPHMDQDFTTPMSGETLAIYNEVAARLEHHRQVWLKLMDAWEQAQVLLDSERFLGSGRARSARRHLRAADAPACLATVLSECEAPLDRIEQAHEQAALDLKSYQSEDQLLSSQLDAVTKASLSIAPYQADRSVAADLVVRSKELLLADPLGAVRCLGEARGKIAEIRRLASKILEHAAAASELMTKLVEIERSATQRRSEGFLLQEEGSNPDPLLAGVRQQQAAILDALNQANESAVNSLLSVSSGQVELARQGLEQHVAAKACCKAELPIRRAEARKLSAEQELARGQNAELARDFAAVTWLGVSENVQRAQTCLVAAERYADQAASDAASNVQCYLRASKLLNQATDNHKHAAAELAAVGKRLRELIELRAACQAQFNQLCTRSDRVNHLLQSSSADRALANERFRAARLSLDRLVDDSRQPRPDWTRLTTLAREIESDLDRAEQLAKEDVQLAQHATAEIAETERVIQDARSFCGYGFTPDVSAAESQLAQARGCLTSQGYEEAIRLANAAEQMARAADQDAISRAQRRQQELESQRRAEQATTISGSVGQAEFEP